MALLVVSIDIVIRNTHNLSITTEGTNDHDDWAGLKFGLRALHTPLPLPLSALVSIAYRVVPIL